MSNVELNQVLRILLSKKNAAIRYAVSERQIDIFRERGMPWISVGPRKILIPIKEADEWIARMMVNRSIRPSDYRPKPSTVGKTTESVASHKGIAPNA